MSLYLEVDNGEAPRMHKLLAQDVIALLHDYDWVHLRSTEYMYWITEWVALERNADGVPTQIGTREFHGEMEIISNA